MAFSLKTWVNRISEYPNRRKLTHEDGSTELVTVARAEGQISVEGNAFSADEMNDLENRIKGGFDEVSQSLDDTKKSVSDGKSSIASAITNNGVTTASDATFATLASKVQELATNRYNSGYNSGYAAAENNGGNCATWLYGANSSLQGLSFDANCFTQSGNALYVKKYGTYHIATTGYTIGGNVNVNGSNKYVGDISAYKGGYNVTLSPGQYIASNMNTGSSGGAGGAVYVKKVS